MVWLTQWTWVSVNSRVGDGQGGLACCDSWGRKESDTTERLIWSDLKMVWNSHLLENFPQFIVIHTVKGFCIVNKAEIDAFLELSCFFDDPADVGTLISGFSAFSKSSLNIWNSMVHVLLTPALENFEHYFTSVWDEYNCAVTWAFFGIAFLWDWNENWPFPVLWPLLSFPNFLAYWVKHFHSIIS